MYVINKANCNGFPENMSQNNQYQLDERLQITTEDLDRKWRKKKKKEAAQLCTMYSISLCTLPWGDLQTGACFDVTAQPS